MFEIDLILNSSPINKIGKSLSKLKTINGTLKNETSILSPTILVENLGVLQANYAHIPSFGRYYFIEDITSVRNNLWEISMKCDVLESFKNEIKQNTAVLSRQEELFNMYLEDEKMSLQSDTFTYDYRFSDKQFKFPATRKNILLVSGFIKGGNS